MPLNAPWSPIAAYSERRLRNTQPSAMPAGSNATNENSGPLRPDRERLVELGQHVREREEQRRRG